MYIYILYIHKHMVLMTESEARGYQTEARRFRASLSTDEDAHAGTCAFWDALPRAAEAELHRKRIRRDTGKPR